MKKAEFERMLVDDLPVLRAFARRFASNTADCNDLVQETVIKALGACESFAKGTNFRGWIYTVMRNTFLNSYEKSKKHSAPMQVEDLTSVHLYDCSVRNQGEAEIVSDDIQKALKRIDSTWSTPFIMHCKGYRYYEIAKALSAPVGTIKNRIHSARRFLKHTLQPYRFYRTTA